LRGKPQVPDQQDEYDQEYDPETDDLDFIIERESDEFEIEKLRSKESAKSNQIHRIKELQQTVDRLETPSELSSAYKIMEKALNTKELARK